MEVLNKVPTKKHQVVFLKECNMKKKFTPIVFLIVIMLTLSCILYLQWKSTYFNQVFDYIENNKVTALESFIQEHPNYLDDLRKFSKRPLDPLVFSIRSPNPNLDIVRILVEKSYKNDIPSTALIESIRLNATAKPFLILIKNLDKKAINSYKFDGGNLLHYVSRHSMRSDKNPALINALLSKGANAYLKDDSGDCFFHILAFRGGGGDNQFDMIKKLKPYKIDYGTKNAKSKTYLDIYKATLKDNPNISRTDFNKVSEYLKSKAVREQRVPNDN